MAEKSNDDGATIPQKCEPFEDLKVKKTWENCKNKDRHGQFIPVCDLENRMDDVPEEFRTDEMMRYIEDICNRTVKLRLSYTSKDRPDTWCDGKMNYPFSDFRGINHMVRYGTGYINYKKMYEDKQCVCKECKNSNHPVVGYLKVDVVTARHVVFDGSELENTTIVCFYDRPDKTEVVELCGGEVLYYDKDPEDEKIYFQSFIHDKDVMDKVNKRIILHYPNIGDGTGLNSGFIVSHPHGIHKHISFGYPRFNVYSIKCDGSSKYPGFVEYRLKHTLSTHNTQIPRLDRRKDDNDDNKIMYLKDVAKIFLPSHHGVVSDRRYEDSWYDIPEGSGFIDSNRKLEQFPKGMEMSCRLDDQEGISYNIAACPGSSGAHVFIRTDSSDIYQDYVHIGANSFLGNTGVSFVKKFPI